ncbi:MAG: clostripain-related cysteine peptidase [Elusimicrobiota bacterium]
MLRRSCAVLCAFGLLWQSSVVFAGTKLDFDQGVDVKETLQTVRSEGANTVPEVAPAPVVAKEDADKPLAEWTIMVFINGKNNLASYGLKDTNEMEAVGSTPKVNVAVELATIKAGSKRYLIAKDDKPGEITSAPVQDLGKVDMGSWSHLADFGIWAKKAYPARRYMLVVWNHGSGWNKERAEVGTRGISYDDETGNHITTQQLAQALSAMGGVDVYASDACLMQMAEVAYELKDSAGVVVGSEETEPGDGYDYTGMLQRIVANPGGGAEAAGQAIVDSYRDWYAAKNQGTTQSSLRADTLKNLVPLIAGWTNAVMQANETTVIKAARTQVQDFYYSDNIDLLHLVKLVGSASQNGAVKSSGEALMRYIQEKIVAANGISGKGYENASGLAVYLPRYSVSNAYADLAWAKESNWDEFAKWFVSIKE